MKTYSKSPIRTSACAWKLTDQAAAAALAGALALISSGALAAPTVSGISGTFAHKSSVTISGSGFGTKVSAAPVVWDDASAGTVPTDNGKWDGYYPHYPDESTTYHLRYTTPIRGIGLPHGRITKYLAGAHGCATLACADVMMWKNRQINSYPAFTYMSWYQRMDDAWVFGGDDNLKVWDLSEGTKPYSFPNNWYIEYNARPTSKTSTPSWHLLDDALSQSSQSLSSGVSWWFGSAVNPMSGAWSKIELEIKYTNQSNGYVKLWENGIQKINYTGTTDKYSGGNRSEAIGGFARTRAPNNWRYFADIYVDYTPQRIVIADNTNLASATVVENLIPTSWSDTSITATVNAGKFADGATAYVFLFDATGQRNNTGYTVTIGSGSGSPPPPSSLPPPAQPNNLRVM